MRERREDRSAGRLPDVVSSTVRTTVSDDTRLSVTQRRVAFAAQETAHMPVEVWSHIQPNVIVNILLTSMTHLWASIHWRICRKDTPLTDWVGGERRAGHVADVPEPAHCSANKRRCPLHARNAVDYTNDDVTLVRTTHNFSGA